LAAELLTPEGRASFAERLRDYQARGQQDDVVAVMSADVRDEGYPLNL